MAPKKRAADAEVHLDNSSDSDSDDDQDELQAFMSPAVSSSSSSSSFSMDKQRRTRERQERKKAKSGRKSDRAGYSKEDAEEAFEDMENRRIGEKCKDKYKGMMSQVTDHGNQHYPELMNENGTLPCPIPVDIVKGFYGTLTKTGNARDKLKGVEDLQSGVNYPVPLSHSHVRTHGSAIKDFYRQNGKSVVDEEVALCMQDVINSYKRCLASLRRKGLMKCSEGKRPLLFQGLVMLCALFRHKGASDLTGRRSVRRRRAGFLP